MDKNSGIETVVNKLDEISNEFRFFKMEVLAGREESEVEVVRQEEVPLFAYQQL